MTLHLIKTKKYDDNDFVAMGLFFLISKAFPLFHRKLKLCSKVIFQYVSINVFMISNGTLFSFLIHQVRKILSEIEFC